MYGNLLIFHLNSLLILIQNFEDIVNMDKINRKKMFIKSIELDVIIANSDFELEYKKRLFAMERGPAVLSQLLKHSLIGKPDDIAQQVRKYMDAGIDQFFLAFQDPFEIKAIRLFMDTVKGFIN